MTRGAQQKNECIIWYYCQISSGLNNLFEKEKDTHFVIVYDKLKCFRNVISGRIELARVNVKILGLLG